MTKQAATITNTAARDNSDDITVIAATEEEAIAAAAEALLACLATPENGFTREEAEEAVHHDLTEGNLVITTAPLHEEATGEEAMAQLTKDEQADVMEALIDTASEMEPHEIAQLLAATMTKADLLAEIS